MSDSPDRQPVQRLNYFKHQFLDEKDFLDEQAYHLRMRRLHNQYLHTWGIVNGLELNALVGRRRVTVGPGLAIDRLGRELLVVEELSLDIVGQAGRTIIITLSYAESQTQESSLTGVTGFTRWIEAPRLEQSESAPPDAGLQLVLGAIKLDADQEIESSDLSQRRRAGVVAGDLQANSLVLGGTLQAQSGQFRGSLSIGGDISIAGRVDGRDLSADGARLDQHLGVTVGNPHGTTSEQVGALPIGGGLLRGPLQIRPAATSTQALIVGVLPANTQPTTFAAAINAHSQISGALGLYVRAPKPPAALQNHPVGDDTPAIRVDGNVLINGGLTVTGAKTGYVVDQFVNASGDELHIGDLVALTGTSVSRFYGIDGDIPVAEVTLADAENASRVIGIVARESIPVGDTPDRRSAPEDASFVDDGGELIAVTLGTFARCKADATSAPIAVGDLLTASHTPGHVCKAIEPQVGSIIGKALQALDEGTGFIAVFVNIQ